MLYILFTASPFYGFFYIYIRFLSYSAFRYSASMSC